MPRITQLLVDLSVSLYRLLLAAYPVAFRNEYGEAMVQLFRDMALADYRRRGVIGLLAMWPRVLVDFTSSVVRQQREKTVEKGHESELLRDLARQWGRLGSAVLATTALSVWYIFHLLRIYIRQSTRVWAALTAAAFLMWYGNFYSTNGEQFFSGKDTSFQIKKGSVEIWHVYECGETLPWELWHEGFCWQIQHDPPLREHISAKPTAWEFSFLSGIPFYKSVRVDARERNPIVQATKSWRLRFPFFILPAFLLNVTILAYCRRYIVSRPVMQSS